MTTRERIFRSRLTSSSIEEITAAAKLFKTHRRREHICELSGQHDWWRKLFSKINLSRLMVICLDNWIEPSPQAFFHIGARGWNCCWNFEEKKLFWTMWPKQKNHWNPPHTATLSSSSPTSQLSRWCGSFSNTPSLAHVEIGASHWQWKHGMPVGVNGWEMRA